VIAEGGSIPLHWRQHNFALRGSITLHRVAIVIAHDSLVRISVTRMLRVHTYFRQEIYSQLQNTLALVISSL
jgi:hypothetical protein